MTANSLIAVVAHKARPVSEDLPFGTITRQELALIAEGKKTAEVRLTREPGLPFGWLGPGDRVLFREEPGVVVGSVEIDRALYFAGLNRSTIRAVKSEFNYRVQAGKESWESEGPCHYAIVLLFKNTDKWPPRTAPKPI